MVNGTTCYCGLTLGDVGGTALPASACTRTCTGDGSESRCGGANGSVVAVWDLASATGSPIPPPFWITDGMWTALDGFSFSNLNTSIPAQIVRRAGMRRAG